MSFKSRGSDVSNRSLVSKNWLLLLCLGSFCAGMFFTDRMWSASESKSMATITGSRNERRNLASDGCVSEQKIVNHISYDIIKENTEPRDTFPTLEKTISDLEMKLAAAKSAHDSLSNGLPLLENSTLVEAPARRKYLMVIGINTAFNSRKRRDSVRATWMPQGEIRKKLEEEKGIVIRFVIGHSSTSGGILDRAIDAEERKHGDFLKLDHVEGYLELSAKTKKYFSTAVSLWDADFYVKVDDDIHVNIATLGMTLAKYRFLPRVYVGCMKSGPVLARKGVRYHEPEYWKFGELGNKYFRHATGQLYAISNDLATYIRTNQNMLHKYANEDVSLGAWFIGLDVEHIDDRRICCGTPPDCEWKAQAGNICISSFDWRCSGICRSDERMQQVHQLCSEDENAVWNSTFEF